MELRMSGMRRKVVVGTVGVLAAGGAFLALGPSAASGSTHASTISLHYVSGKSAFQGRVKSDTTDCQIGRPVKLFKTGGGSVGSATTNVKGFYRIPYPLTAGSYYTVARKVTLPGYSSTVCNAARSTLRVIS